MADVAATDASVKVTVPGPDTTLQRTVNAAGGFGLTRDSASALFRAGADVLTGGNHLWDRKEAIDYLAGEARLVRPANLPPGVPGQGWRVFTASALPDKAAVLAGANR